MTWKAHTRDLVWLRERVTVNSTTGCWEWKLRRNAHGYGVYGVQLAGEKHTTRRAHRLAFELAAGRPVDPGAAVCHRCDNPPCCNPEHLFEDAQTGNMRDMGRKGRAGSGRLLPADVEVIRLALASGRRGTAAALARQYGVTETAISRIKNGQTWTAGP